MSPAPAPLPTSLYWRQRAQSFRELASTVAGQDAKDTFLRIVDQYEHLALQARERDGEPEPDPERIETPALATIVPTPDLPAPEPVADAPHPFEAALWQGEDTSSEPAG